MATVSPPKPWERAGAGGNTSTTSTSSTLPTSSSAPALPAKPTLNNVVSSNAATYAQPGYGYNAPYGGNRFNSYNSYGNRFGGYGVGGYGGYGGGYGMGGYGMGVGGYGVPMGPNGEMSLTNTFNQSTQATFQIIESIVGAFGGFAQMLESTYMATHSSFFAMISVAEQFSNLKDTLGSILGIFALMRWARTLFAKLTGRPPPADATSLTPGAFARFQGRKGIAPDGSPLPPKPSKKPFLFFLAAAFGLPYLMGKLIRAMAKSQEDAALARGLVRAPDGSFVEPAQLAAMTGQPAIDPSQLDFCRVLFDYTPDSSATSGFDMRVTKGDLVAVLSRNDPQGQPSEWWRCRSRDGRVGYLPSPYLELVKRRPKEITASVNEAGDSRTATMNSSISQSTKLGEVPVLEKKDDKPTANSVDGFMKGQFYS